MHMVFTSKYKAGKNKVKKKLKFILRDSKEILFSIIAGKNSTYEKSQNFKGLFFALPMNTF